jgi:hypothetical protein
MARTMAPATKHARAPAVPSHRRQAGSPRRPRIPRKPRVNCCKQKVEGRTGALSGRWGGAHVRRVGVPGRNGVSADGASRRDAIAAAPRPIALRYGATGHCEGAHFAQAPSGDDERVRGCAVERPRTDALIEATRETRENSARRVTWGRGAPIGANVEKSSAHRLACAVASTPCAGARRGVILPSPS